MLTTDLITSIQRRAAIPVAQITFSTTDFLQMIDEELGSKLLPLILAQMEEFYVRDKPYNITSGQNSYAIPSRATASMLRDVQIISSTDPDSICPLERLEIESLYASTGSSPNLLIQKNGFYIKSNTIYMYPTPVVTQNILNLEYYGRPGSSVEPSSCGLVQTIDRTLNEITVASLPSNITTATPVDFIQALSGFDTLAIDQTITNVAGNVITMSEDIPDSLIAGDYVCQATQSCVVQAPQELLPLLSQYVTVRVLSSQGDAQSLDAAIKELSKLETNASMLISPRVSGKPKRVTNTRGVSRFV